jgi:integrase
MGDVKFYLKKDKGTESKRPIMMSYHFNGQRLFYYTGKHISEAHFSVKSKSSPAGPGCPDRIIINQKLTALKQIVGAIELEYMGKLLTPALLKIEIDNRYKLRKPVHDKLTFEKYFEQYIEDLPKKINRSTGRALSATMPAKYKTAKNTFSDFCSFKGRTYDFEDIDEDFYNSFLMYLQQEKGLAKNTIGRLIKYLKTVLNDAVAKNVTKASSYRTALKSITEETEQVYLDEKELETIYRLDLAERPALEKVRDLFLIGCWTGLRFSDFTRIKPENVKKDRIKIKQQKTGKEVIIPIIGPVKEIMEKYNFQLPEPISPQKFNKHLKTIASLAEISEEVTRGSTVAGKNKSETKKKYELIGTHTARRSFATNAYRRKIAPALIAAITGHKTETEFMKYIRVSAEDHAQMFENEYKEISTKQRTTKSK